MNKIVQLCFIFFMFLTFNIKSFSQEFLELMSDPKVNVYDVQKKFEEYWQEKPSKEVKDGSNIRDGKSS
ncbi:MAG: hypothetical protein IPL53_01130 [Ignavibacteria bacterium]|nr:hypothetical protein [Ignavibacteria bacterium]